jgi:hypothetical protein
VSPPTTNSALKHAVPGEIRIGLWQQAGRLVLEVEDDGEGIPEILPPGAGMGLQVMRHRTQLLGGGLAFATARVLEAKGNHAATAPNITLDSRPLERDSRMPTSFADSDQVQVGDIVVLAVGNPFGLGQSCSMVTTLSPGCRRGRGSSGA